MSTTTIPSHTAAPGSEFRDGWSVVLACFCAATFAWGFGFYGLSVYLAALQADLGWSASLVASMTTAYYLVGALALTQVYRVMAWAGPRFVLALGMAILGIGAIGLSHVSAPWQLYAAGVVMAIGWAGTT